MMKIIRSVNNTQRTHKHSPFSGESLGELQLFGFALQAFFFMAKQINIIDAVKNRMSYADLNQGHLGIYQASNS
jgi:hypothetical protein